MNNWVLIICVVDVAFMVGILFMLFSFRKGRPVTSTELALDTGMPASFAEFDVNVMAKLKEELSNAKSITERLDKKRYELEELENSLISKKRAMEKVLKRAAVEPRIQQRKWHDTYEGATDMLNHGASVDSVIEKFDLLSGEAELITSLNNLKS